MKSMILAGVATAALGLSGALAQNAPSTAPSNSGQFIDKQTAGEFRAPKLVGVGVYDSSNKSVGKISDLLLDKDGSVKAVVISVGGFLGIGSKYVALPYSALSWQTEQRSAAVGGATSNDAMGANPTRANGTDTAPKGDASATTGAAPSHTGTVDPAQTEAYQGYPDRAVIAMSQEQLKSAPEFKYASNPNVATPGAAGNGPMTGAGDTNKTKP